MTPEQASDLRGWIVTFSVTAFVCAFIWLVKLCKPIKWESHPCDDEGDDA